ncbi:toll-like receptor Tollo isoform X1 [Centruroides sculpturatus]|uniref:toll-like receptor Tollo isoform X1 n=2 Tax=Centruroides sculpturatus TaxID=218467 RepID=UPI000C6ED138|nr:toll-like receptor Tollo isoform X1 [Centruroides sculpturatus]XP_023239018.1 toll-like receptor Tollo isoform X1 [Centruroides sculpturatus]
MELLDRIDRIRKMKTLTRNVTLICIQIATNLNIITSIEISKNTSELLIHGTHDNFHEISCRELKHCNCSMNGDYITINCINLRNFTELMNIVRQKFSNRSISHVYISHSSIDKLPANAFAGLNIMNIYIRRSTIGSVDNDVFVGTNHLIQLRLDNTRLLSFPTSIKLLNLTLRCLWMERGELNALGTELRKFRLQILSLKQNKIHYVDPDAFVDMIELKVLNLANNRIRIFGPTTFRNLQRLQTLTLLNNELESVKGLLDDHPFTIQIIQLQNNKLRSIRNITDRPLYSLQSLLLSNNPIEVIDENSFGNNFPQLNTLYLTNTHLIRIESRAFQNLIKLRQVILNNNRLEYLDDDLFANIMTLQKIDIATNKIRDIKNLFKRSSGILTLLLSNNTINDIENCFNYNKHLKTLFLDGNEITIIKSNTFFNNNKLKIINLDQNKIEYLEKDCFRGLYNLKKLLLSNNRITTLNGSLDNLPHLEILYLNDNLLTVLDPKHFQRTLSINTISLNYNKLISVEKAFQNLQNLQYVSLKNNFLKTLTEETFSLQVSLKMLELRKNPITCDCRIGWLIEAVLDHRFKFDKVYCKKPKWLKHKQISNLTLSDVVEWKTDCPDNCKCQCHANLTDWYINVNCANRNLEKFPDRFPEKTNYLDISHNEIQVIPSQILGNLSHLQHLLLHFNNFTSLQNLSDLKLQSLMLSNNKFTRFPVNLIQIQYLESISLSKNPWICDCETLPFVKWILSEQNKIIDVDETRCSENNVKFKMHKIISLTELQLCPSFILLYSVIGAAIAVILLFLAGGKIIYNKYRMHIRVWMYSRGFSCFKEDDFNENKLFDAFISYSRLDESFVKYILAPNLENGEKSFHLCIHYRHFIPGSYIQDNIINAVKASKRTVLILSQNFLSSEWCRLEFKSAHHQVLEERLNRLIVIILGDLPPDDDIDPEILLYLQTTTYLRWGEKNFWNKLYYAMPKTPCNVQDRESVHLLSDYD